MRADATWKGGYASELSDTRGHAVTVDLDPTEGGLDRGTSALELCVLALAGCITTIFTLVAERRRLTFGTMRVELEARRARGARTITSVEGTFRISTSAPPDDVGTALRITLGTCPVGVLFEQAHVPVTVRPVVTPPDAAPLSGPAIDSQRS